MNHISKIKKLKKSLYTIDQTNPVLPKLYGLDNIGNLGDEEYNEEIKEEDNENEEEIVLRRLSKTPQPSTWLRNFITYTVQYPIQDFISYTNISPQYLSFLISISKE